MAAHEMAAHEMAAHEMAAHEMAAHEMAAHEMTIPNESDPARHHNIKHPVVNQWWANANCYHAIPPETIYIALDQKERVIISVFPYGLEMVYGPGDGAQMARLLLQDILAYAQSQPPPKVLDRRHANHDWWVEQNPQFAPPTGRCGVYHWGAWLEKGHEHKGPMTTKDTLKGGTTSGPVEAATRSIDLRYMVLSSWRPLTEAISILFGALDKNLRNQYRLLTSRLPPEIGVRTAPSELFTLRAVLVNVLSEPHTDDGDWIAGMSWLAVFGKFRGGHLCLPQLGIKVPMPHGSITGMRGAELQHHVDKWDGTSRVSIVHTFQEAMRRGLAQEDKATREWKPFTKSGQRSGVKLPTTLGFGKQASKGQLVSSDGREEEVVASTSKKRGRGMTASTSNSQGMAKLSSDKRVREMAISPSNKRRRINKGQKNMRVPKIVLGSPVIC
jgi:hypothetical protein